MRNLPIVLLTTALLTPSLALAMVNDHPVIKPMPGAQLVDTQSRYEDFGEYRSFYTMDGRRRVGVTKRGRHWRLRYLFKAGGKVDKSVSAVEIIANYKAAALAKGAEIKYEARNMLTFVLPRSQTWVSVHGGRGSYWLHIVEERALQQKLTFGVEQIRSALDREGQIALYGISFDVDKATLQLGAEKVLVEIVKLLKASNVRVEVQGHTDNSGSPKHNLNLSRRRAETVRSFLMTYGVAKAQIVPKGYGQTKPIASNDDEAGRAKNRRVVLVKLDE